MIGREGFIAFPLSSGVFMMLINMNNKLETCSRDNFLYEELGRLLSEIKLAQGGTSLDATLRRHNKIRIYLISKQIDKIRDIEQTYFNEDGTLNDEAIMMYLEAKRACQKTLSDIS